MAQYENDELIPIEVEYTVVQCDNGEWAFILKPQVNIEYTEALTSLYSFIKDQLGQELEPQDGELTH